MSRSAFRAPPGSGLTAKCPGFPVCQQNRAPAFCGRFNARDRNPEPSNRPLGNTTRSRSPTPNAKHDILNAQSAETQALQFTLIAGILIRCLGSGSIFKCSNPWGVRPTRQPAATEGTSNGQCRDDPPGIPDAAHALQTLQGPLQKLLPAHLGMKLTSSCGRIQVFVCARPWQFQSIRFLH